MKRLAKDVSVHLRSRTVLSKESAADVTYCGSRCQGRFERREERSRASLTVRHGQKVQRPGGLDEVKPAAGFLAANRAWPQTLARGRECRSAGQFHSKEWRVEGGRKHRQ